MDTVIEILKSNDLPLYKNLLDECFGDSNPLEAYAAYKEDGSYTVFVIKDEGRIIASAIQYPIELFAFANHPAMMIFNLAVSPAYRKNKLGHKLLEHIIDNAKSNGYGSVSITCLVDAHGAHRLYESMGFVRTDNIKFDMKL